MYFDHHNDVICAPATIPGTGAIAVIRVSGEGCFEVADAVVSCRKGRLADAPGYTIKFGIVEGLDEVLVSVFRAPHSYTGENSVEISCHASTYIVTAVLERLYAAGARAAEPGEFTRRAFLNGKMDLAQAEAVADVIASSNAAAHRVALSQLKGGFSSELKLMRDELLHIVSLMELELDFSEEEVEFADRGELVSLLERVVGHISSLVDSFRLGNAIKNGVPVAIVGATNTGKSTLLNALLGEERAIVSDVHGTTRDTIEETYNIGGVLFRFIDTAGLRTTDETVEKIGIERTLRKLHDASVVLVMLDVSRSKEELSATLDEIVPQMDFAAQKVVLLLNKVDAVADNSFTELRNDIVSYLDNHKIASSLLAISAKRGDGINALRTWLADSQKDSVSASLDSTLVTNQRHYQALYDARTALCRVLNALCPTCAAGDGPVLANSAVLGADPTGKTSANSRADAVVYSGCDSAFSRADAVVPTEDSPLSGASVPTGDASAILHTDAVIPTEFLSQDIREAIYHLGSIVGEISTDEVLGNIFSHFCIGK